MKKVLKVVGFCSLIFVQNSCIASDYEEEDTRTLEELEQCPCVQEYVFQKYGEDLTASAKQQKQKKKKKKTKTQQSRQSSQYSSYEDYKNDYDQDQRSSRSSNRDRSRTTQNRDLRQKQQRESREWQQNRNRSSSSQIGNKKSGNSDNSWMHEMAWINLKTPFTATEIFAQDTISSSKNSNGKSSIEVFKNLEIKSKNLERPKYKINEKESIRFRQELEKYRQVLA